MNMKLFLFLLLALLPLLSCEFPTTSDETPQPVRPSHLLRFSVSQVYYDSLRIQSLPELTVPRKDFQIVTFGSVSMGIYTELASAIPSFTGGNGSYTMIFDVRFRIDSTKYIVNLRANYLYADGYVTTIDTSVYTVSYPYQSATFFLSSSIHPSSFMRFQDVDGLGTRFLYHPIGGEGLFEYNLLNGQTRELMRYGAGDHIAADSHFVFADINHNSVWRYDLSKDSAKRIISTPAGASIGGLDTYGGYLYVLEGLGFFGPPGSGFNLKKYSFDGVIVDSLLCPTNRYFMAINEGVVYRVLYPDRLSRFDISTKTALPDISAPARNGDGIKFSNGYFYFIDYSKGIVGRMPAVDLK